MKEVEIDGFWSHVELAQAKRIEKQHPAAHQLIIEKRLCKVKQEEKDAEQAKQINNKNHRLRRENFTQLRNALPEEAWVYYILLHGIYKQITRIQGRINACKCCGKIVGMYDQVFPPAVFISVH